MNKREDAAELAFLWIGGAICAVCIAGIVTACIVGPLTGHWEVLLAVGFWAAVVGSWYALYRVFRRGA